MPVSTSLNAVTSAGPGATTDLGPEPLSNHTMFVSCTGASSAGSGFVSLQGSHDGVNWHDLVGVSIGGNNSFAVDTLNSYGQPGFLVRYVRANCTAFPTGGTSPTVTASIASASPVTTNVNVNVTAS